MPKYKQLYTEQLELTSFAHRNTYAWQQRAYWRLAALVAVLLSTTVGLGYLGWLASIAMGINYYYNSTN